MHGKLPTPSRRDMMLGIGATLGIGAVGARAAPPADPRVVLLGTKGGPTPSALRAEPGTALVIKGRTYLVDCGNGVGGQLAKANIALPSLAEVFITHNHSDHIADVGTLMAIAWASGLNTRVTIHGPPPIAQIVASQLSAFNYDVAVRMREEGRGPLKPLIHVEERHQPGVVLRNADVTVTAALVDHYTAAPAFAYRFDVTGGRSIVLSGDTTYNDRLIALAKGADVLICEALYLPAVPQMAPENAATLEDHLRRSHSTTEQVGQMAARAGVKKLVLTHLVPAWPSITDYMWLAGVRRSFHGEVIVGRDLMDV